MLLNLSKQMEKENWNVSGMNAIITIHIKTMILTTVSNVATAIQLISHEIGLSMDSVLQRYFYSLIHGTHDIFWFSVY